MTHTPLHFTKMHALGNDFIVVNNLTQTFPTDTATLTQLSDRHTGIGFDQALLIEPSTSADFFCRIFNTDGSEAQQCGNGLRCVARYLRDKACHAGETLTLETRAGVFNVTFHENHEITVTLGAPQSRIEAHSLTIHDQPLQLHTVSLGNPHGIIRVESASSADVDRLGHALNTHSNFKDGLNVGFMEVITPHHIRLRTYERGVGETLACGSNACAAALIGINQAWLSSPVEVTFERGSVVVGHEGGSHPITLTGGASLVFEGTLEKPTK